LAAKVHLDKWIKLTTKNSEALQRVGEKAGISTAEDTSLKVVSWAYHTRSIANGFLWTCKKQ
jgi:hypothetical protein